MNTRNRIDAQFEGWSTKPGEVWGEKVTTIGRDGEKVSAYVGGPVYFKADVEQCGRVKEVRTGPRGPQVKVDILQGEYRGKNQWIDLADCWS